MSDSLLRFFSFRLGSLFGTSILLSSSTQTFDDFCSFLEVLCSSIRSICVSLIMKLHVGQQIVKT
ncbi:hypothetical protein GcC1_c12985o12 [Golovinomyces cichoracearum]|uniref:Uncharacterized protein n=1 Tax=Golovinomyces cichoracearum TaxID=62708 RepID=A0A420J431_9PEZI|nr:hypothetical protein GcC1_c12985o12 [Golovinomyces cichoracearum]